MSVHTETSPALGAKDCVVGGASLGVLVIKEIQFEKQIIEFDGFKDAKRDCMVYNTGSTQRSSAVKELRRVAAF